MTPKDPVLLTRDVEAAIVPIGSKVTLQKGERAWITQDLGGAYTVVVNGNLFRIDGKDANALGLEVAPKAVSVSTEPVSLEQLEKQVWDELRSCYDPEIPVNIVDLGLIYDCHIAPVSEKAGTHKVDVRMTLTAPGCGMGPVLQQDVQNKIIALEGVDEVNVELVWDPPWNQGMMTEAAKLQLGFM
jgi:probable FeS assembly SUF system protein SufT